jgi:hypothetical protein
MYEKGVKDGFTILTVVVLLELFTKTYEKILDLEEVAQVLNGDDWVVSWGYF